MLSKQISLDVYIVEHSEGVTVTLGNKGVTDEIDRRGQDVKIFRWIGKDEIASLPPAEFAKYVPKRGFDVTDNFIK